MSGDIQQSKHVNVMCLGTEQDLWGSPKNSLPTSLAALPVGDSLTWAQRSAFHDPQLGWSLKPCFLQTKLMPFYYLVTLLIEKRTNQIF
jgi:hypothetical protein